MEVINCFSCHRQGSHVCITDTTSKEKKRMDAVRKRETGVIFGVKGADSDISRSQKYITVEIPTT